MCEQVHDLAKENPAYFEVRPKDNRESLMLRKMAQLKLDTLVPADRPGVKGFISRLVAVLDEHGDRWMHFTTAKDAWREYVRKLLDRQPSVGMHTYPSSEWRRYDLILRDTNKHSDVIYLRVPILNVVWQTDKSRLNTFFADVTAGFLEFNRLIKHEQERKP